MSRKKLLATLFTVLCLIAIILFTYTLAVQPTLGESGTENEGLDNLDIDNGGKLFVVPEIPLGTLGSISVCALALGLFALKKQRA